MSKKEIGQFFSGPKVSNLLVLAAELLEVETITAIDPMVGRADMLVALQQHGVPANRLYGIDIDDEAVTAAKARLDASHFLTTDAFSSTAAGLYSSQDWDLVITNPPYVRYQALKAIYGNNAVEIIRKKLIETLELLDVAWSKRMYLESAESYSGLADLAVPCWILCACLVRPGGKLAMVLPDAWLKREYASIIRDVLKEDFEVERIIVDEGRAWFSDAQIKTNLLVATKRGSNKEKPDNTHVYHIGLSKRAADRYSLAGALVYDGRVGNEAFIRLCQSDTDYTSSLVWARHEDIDRDVRATLLNSRTRTASLCDWGFRVGQGLRTGANGFFYFWEDETGRVHNEIWEESVELTSVEARRLPLVPVLRYQGEIGNSYGLTVGKSGYRLLLINEPISDKNYGTGVDIESLSKYIKYCEGHDVIRGRQRQRIPELSAVRTNGALSNISKAERYWYMLPDLKDRHLPDLVIPRINGGVVRTYLMPGNRHVVADANFSTIWVDGDDYRKKYVALALLNSTYVRLELERNCSVLGGGALKCEAVSLRKMTLPKPWGELMETLSQLGAQLAAAQSIDETMHIQASIDGNIAQAMSKDECPGDLLLRWTEELRVRLKLRNE